VISVEKPGSPSEILEHAGVKGMKWGVRNESKRTGSRPSKPLTKGIAPSRSSREFAAKFPTSASRSHEIRRARVQSQAQFLKAASETNPAKRDKLIRQWRDSPDRAVALRTTRGEKVVLGVLAGALAVPTLGTAPAALAGYAGTTAAIRKGIERSQAKRARQ
jgi:hypothetical protein